MIGEGSRVGEAVLEEQVGEGASATVWRAQWRGRPVVVKLPHVRAAATDEYVARVTREAAALRAIESEHVVGVLDVGRSEEGLAYVVLERIDGPTLRETIEHRHAEVTPAIAARWLDELGAALEAAHRAGVIHRDVKPENVMLQRGVLKLVDFGLAKPQDDVAKLTATGAPLGTPAYMAPEQWWNEGVGPAADQYAYGLVAYELVAGAPPFAQTSLPELMEAHLHQAPPPIPNAPQQVAACLTRMLEKDPTKRYPSIADARVALREALGGATPSRLPRLVPPILLVALPVLLFACGYPGARDPRASIPLAGWAIFAVFGAYLLGAVFVRRSWLFALGPALLGTLSTYTGWRVVLRTVDAVAASDRVPILHQGLYEANVNRFFGLGLSAALWFALASTYEAKRFEGALRRHAAIALGLLFAAATAALWLRSSTDLLWTSDLPRAARTAALLALEDTKRRSALPISALLAFSIVALALATRRYARGLRPWLAALREAARVPALALASWIVVDLVMLARLREHIADVVSGQASELDLMAQLDPPSADGLPPAPVGPALKIARDRVLVDDAPVGLTSALERGGLDDVLRADLSHRLARDEAPGLLVLIADRSVSTAAIQRALDVAKSVGVTELAILYTRGPSPKIDTSSEAAATLPGDFGARSVKLEGLTLEGERYEDAAAAVLRRPDQ